MNNSNTCSTLPVNCAATNKNGTCTSCNPNYVFISGTTTCVPGTIIQNGGYTTTAYDIGNVYLSTLIYGSTPIQGTACVSSICVYGDYWAGAVK